MVVEIKFEFKDEMLKISIKCEEDDTFEKVIQNLKSKIKIKIDGLSFYSNGKKINKNDIIKNLMNEMQKEKKKIKIIAEYDKNLTANKYICPNCKEICTIKNYNIKLYDCQNGHKIKNLKFDEFYNIQSKDLSKLICDNCKNKINFDNIFYSCYECKINLCNSCFSTHDNTHSFLNCESKNNMDINQINSSNEKKIKYKLSNKYSRFNIKNMKIEHIFSFKVKTNQKYINQNNEIDIKEIKTDKNINKQEKKIESIADYKNIKSKYIFKNILKFLSERKLLNIIKHNKNIQKILNINEKYYKEYCQIEIEIIPCQNEDGKFINIFKKEDKPYFHIYFNDNNKEEKRNYLTKNDKINKIKIIMDYQIKSIKDLFDNCNCIKSVNFIKFNRNDFKSFYGMFYSCSLLKEINLSKVNTENIKDMSYLFSLCKSLEKIDFTNFKTIQVEEMSSMFAGCSSLKKLNLYSFNTKNVREFTNMFENCSSLEKINILNFDTDNTISMSNMFSNCSSIKEINLSNFKTDKVIYMYLLFSKCSSLKYINLSHFNTKNVKDMSSMFSGCSSLKEIDISNFNTDNVEDMSNMFKECSSLIKVNFPNIKTSNVTNMSYMFTSCFSLNEINVSNFNTNNVTNMSHMFSGCSNLIKIDLSNFKFDNIDLSFLFSDCTLLTEVILPNFNMEDIININSMFKGCSNNLKNEIRKNYKDLREEAFN